MSWLKEMAGGQGPAPYKEPTDGPSEARAQDPAIPGRTVSTKQANRPFLAYKEYRDKQEALHQAWLVKKKERDEKIARGEKVGPLERDPTAEEEVGLLGLLKFLVYLLIFIALAGKFITGSYTWESDSKWLRLQTYLPTNQRLFSERQLATFDGSDASKPVYLAIDGDVYDVSSGKAYQPGGSYAILAGVDAARAFGTGCFKAHRTHDLRGLDKQELDGVTHWKKFFAEHKTYVKVGKVMHHPIDPASPIPEHCNPKKEQKAKERAAANPPADQRTDHQEL
ncbi:hypothetical protein HGRIS_009842 [Hohenbuehelia grisea]|uniref:Cytochrome b5 heme-binding domain-containing protein n=1 Tax=Hohenbuehelia grisea TaxID=104357 RepID=A0ABR3J2N8_9AGAR